MEIYISGVGGTHFDNQSVKVWDANSGEYYGERFTTNSLVIFDNITSVNTEPVDYIKTAGYYPQRESIYFTSQKSGKVKIIVSDIIGQSRKVVSNTYGGREEIKLSRLGFNKFANGFYAVRIITPTESYSLGLIKNGINYAAKKVVKLVNSTTLQKTTLADEIRVEVTHEDHYKRTFTAEKSERVEDYVVEYVEQMKTNGEAVTPEEFKQYCQDFNMNSGAGGMGPGLKSFFPNENKQIWILSTSPTGEYTLNEQQINGIKDLIEQEIYPYISQENRPEFVLDDPSNPLPNSQWPLTQEGIMFIYPRVAGYNFSVTGDPNTGVILRGYAQVYEGLDLGDITQPPANDQERIARAGVLEEVASCFMGPRDNQGPPYHIMRTIFVNDGKMNPIDIKLFEMGQKYKPMTPIDDVLGIE